MYHKHLFCVLLTISLVGCSGDKKKSDGAANETSAIVVQRELVSLATSVQQNEESLWHVAPEKCLAFALWKGIGSESNSNPADKLLANPLFSLPFIKTASAFSTMPYIAAGVDCGMDDPEKSLEQFQLIQSLRSSPATMQALAACNGCAFVDVELPQNFGFPEIDAAIVFETGQQTDEILQTLLAGIYPFGSNEPVAEIDGVNFAKVSFDMDPEMDLMIGGTNGLTIVGYGEKSIHGVLSRLKNGSTPKWLESALANQAWPQMTEYLRIDVESIVGIVGEIPQELESLKLDEIKTVELVTGRTEKGILHRLAVNGGHNAMGIYDYSKLDFSKFDYIPADAQISMVAGMQLEKAYRRYLRLMMDMNPYDREMLEAMEKEFAAEMGFDIRKDILRNLGKNFSFHSALNDDLLGGMVFSVDIKNREGLEKVVEKLINNARQYALEESYYGPSIRLQKMGDHVVGCLTMSDVVIEPCWCITDERLIVSFSPEAMQTMLHSTGQPSLFVEGITDQFKRFGKPVTDDKLVFAGYVDTKTLAQACYPFLRGGVSLLKGNASWEFDGDDPLSQQMMHVVTNLDLPPLRTLIEGVGPTTFAIRSNEQAVEYEFHHTLPLTNPIGLVATGFTVALPAISNTNGPGLGVVQNNLRQVGLACHNYESTYGRFPTDIVDENEKPLLSWRVAILPYIEEYQLYEQFKTDESWDSEHNRKLIDQLPLIYKPQQTNLSDGHTTTRGIGGKEGTFLPGGEGVRFATMRDGTSNTIMAVIADPEFSVEWTKPGALNAESVDIEELFGKSKTMVAQFADGSVQKISKRLGEDKIRMLFTRRDGNVVDLYSEMPSGPDMDNPIVAAFANAIQETNRQIYGDVEIIWSNDGYNYYRDEKRAIDWRDDIDEFKDAPIEEVPLEAERIDIE